MWEEKLPKMKTWLLSSGSSAISSLLRSNDGRFLVVSSSDGYCSILSFDPGELGVPLSPEKLPPPLANTQTQSKPEVDTLPQTTPSPPLAVRAEKDSPPVCSATGGHKGNSVKPRRIRPTIIAAFSSPDKQTKEVSGCEDKSNEGNGSLPVTPVVDHPSSASPQHPPATSDSVPAIATPSTEDAEVKQNSTSDTSQQSSSSVTPRRVNFVTLSSTPLVSASTLKTSPTAVESEHSSVDTDPLRMSPKTGQTYSRRVEGEGEGGKSEGEEPMEVQIIE